MFLIDMKFISKLLEMFLWKMYRFLILIFPKLYKKWGIRIFKNVHRRLCFLSLFILYKNEYLILYYILWRWGSENDKFSIKHISQILDINFISVKNMKWKCGKSYKLFYFQVRESPAPLNIPTPTPAPDRGGPVACLSGPVNHMIFLIIFP